MNDNGHDTDPLWYQAISAVTQYSSNLRRFTEHGQLYGWAVMHGLDGPDLWPKVKYEMRRQLGIDFDQIRAATHAARRAAIAHADTGPALRLWAAADHAQQSFAVCGPHGVVWYDNLSLDDWWYRGDQPTAELSAAHRAIWLAGRARTLARFGAARLTLHLSSPEIPARALAGSIERARLAVTVEIVDAATNHAVEWCRKPGRRVSTELADFVDDIEPRDTPAVSAALQTDDGEAV
ncbi:hypothetical protein [Nocardia concava]|uniref:hypothetical protein n=1 Tax=Nocardia concava TaxID=257281 RepID=UPI00031C7E90|nr:hypothetical protein [Nocardia concava]